MCVSKASAEARGFHYVLELKLQAVVSCLPWIRGTKFWTSKRVECARSHWAIFLDPQSVVSVTQITSSCCFIRKELQQLVHESRNSSRSSSVNFWFAPRSSECDTISVWIKFLIFNSLVKPGWEGTVLTGSLANWLHERMQEVVNGSCLNIR